LQRRDPRGPLERCFGRANDRRDLTQAGCEVAQAVVRRRVVPADERIDGLPDDARVIGRIGPQRFNGRIFKEFEIDHVEQCARVRALFRR
jgi:hypothetical protein